MGKVKAHELRNKSKSDLLAQLAELRTELASVIWYNLIILF